MSSLILPTRKLWSPDWGPLLTHLQTGVGGHLIKTASAHLAKGCGMCCDTYSPSTVTLAGGTDCWALFNGTYAVSYASACRYEFSSTFSVVDECATTGTGCYDGFGWLHKKSIDIAVVPSSTGHGMSVFFDLQFSLYIAIPTCQLSANAYRRPFHFDSTDCGATFGSPIADAGNSLNQPSAGSYTTFTCAIP